MINHPNRRRPFSPRLLSDEADRKITAYVDWIFAECLGEGEDFTLGRAWREATIWTEKSLIAAAIIYRADALSDRPYKIIDERGEYADDRLAYVADELGLA